MTKDQLAQKQGYRNYSEYLNENFSRSEIKRMRMNEGDNPYKYKVSGKNGTVEEHDRNWGILIDAPGYKDKVFTDDEKDLKKWLSDKEVKRILSNYNYSVLDPQDIDEWSNKQEKITGKPAQKPYITALQLYKLDSEDVNYGKRKNESLKRRKRKLKESMNSEILDYINPELEMNESELNDLDTVIWLTVENASDLSDLISEYADDRDLAIGYNPSTERVDDSFISDLAELAITDNPENLEIDGIQVYIENPPRDLMYDLLYKALRKDTYQLEEMASDAYYKYEEDIRSDAEDAYWDSEAAAMREREYFGESLKRRKRRLKESYYLNPANYYVTMRTTLHLFEFIISIFETSGSDWDFLERFNANDWNDPKVQEWLSKRKNLRNSINDFIYDIYDYCNIDAMYEFLEKAWDSIDNNMESDNGTTSDEALWRAIDRLRNILIYHKEDIFYLFNSKLPSDIDFNGLYID